MPHNRATLLASEAKIHRPNSIGGGNSLAIAQPVRDITDDDIVKLSELIISLYEECQMLSATSECPINGKLMMEARSKHRSESYAASQKPED